MKIICVDTGFLIALYDKNDSNHQKAIDHFKDYFENKPNSILIPWPILYETFRTKFVKNKTSLTELMNDWSKLGASNQLILCDDSDYRLIAFKEYSREIEREFNQYRSLSLTDRVIRNMLREPNLNITALITFNIGDFSDVCTYVKCELIT